MTRRDWLRARLLELAPVDASERAHRERMLALLDARGDPFDRTRYEPGHFTASAFVLSAERSHLLLIHHAKLRRWLQPGGHVEPGDADLLVAARREVEEETGLTEIAAGGGLLDVDVHAIPPRGQAPAHEHFDVRFVFIAASDTLRPGSEVLDAKWVPLAGIPELESDASVTRAVRKLSVTRGD